MAYKAESIKAGSAVFGIERRLFWHTDFEKSIKSFPVSRSMIESFLRILVLCLVSSKEILSKAYREALFPRAMSQVAACRHLTVA